MTASLSEVKVFLTSGRDSASDCVSSIFKSTDFCSPFDKQCTIKAKIAYITTKLMPTTARIVQAFFA
jgi:hypothetical protein